MPLDAQQLLRESASTTQRPSNANGMHTSTSRASTMLPPQERQHQQKQNLAAKALLASDRRGAAIRLKTLAANRYAPASTHRVEKEGVIVVALLPKNRTSTVCANQHLGAV